MCGRAVVSCSLQLHGVIQHPLGYLNLSKVSAAVTFLGLKPNPEDFPEHRPLTGCVAAVAGARQHKLHLPFLSTPTGAIPGNISLASANLAQMELELPLCSVSRSRDCPWLVFPSLVLQGGVWGWGCSPPQFQPAVIPSGFPDFLTALQPVLMFSGLGAALEWWECQEWDVHKTRFDLLEKTRLGEGSVQTVNIWGGLCSPR